MVLPDAAGVADVAAVVALKPLAHAKSRLALPPPLRRRLALTMALDTLSALSAALPRVLVVSNQPGLASLLRRAGIEAGVVGEPARGGMNAALAAGARVLSEGGAGSVLACVADLPALRADSVRRIAVAARAWPQAFLADASGIGTTMVVATGRALDPRFQGRSAAAHRAMGAVPLDEQKLGAPCPDARADVDTEIDLFAAAHLGLGEATAALLEPGTGRLGRYRVLTATARTDSAGSVLAVTEDGHRLSVPASALSDGLRHLRLGQRLHAVETDGTVLSAWI